MSISPKGCWFDALDPRLAGTIALVVANPPYVSAAEWAGLDPVVRDHEPRLALVSGDSGLESIEEILAGAPRWLRPGGHLVLELAPAQAEAVALVRHATPGTRRCASEPDLAGRARALVARWPGP